MTDKPILFNAPMVQALLDDRKTQTRRGLTIKGHKSFSEFGPSDTAGYDWHFRDAEMRWHDLRHAELLAKLPYAVGDRLWVRETFTVGYDYDDDDKPVGDEPRCFYAASECPRWYDTDTDSWQDSPKWSPSIHMPRWASRITLTVTDVRVERLQDISEADAIAEGVGTVPSPLGIAKSDFADLWESINGPGSWEANPWVVALTFDVALRNIDEVTL